MVGPGSQRGVERRAGGGAGCGCTGEDQDLTTALVDHDRHDGVEKLKGCVDDPLGEGIELLGAGVFEEPAAEDGAGERRGGIDAPEPFHRGIDERGGVGRIVIGRQIVDGDNSGAEGCTLVDEAVGRPAEHEVVTVGRQAGGERRPDVAAAVGDDGDPTVDHGRLVRETT